MANKRKPETQQQTTSKEPQKAPVQPLQTAPVQMPMQTTAQPQTAIPAPVAAPVVVNRIGEEQITKAMQILRKYKGGKAHLESQIIAAQQWWKLRNWEQIRLERGTKGASTDKSSTAWLWNCIVGKHADYMDAYPEPVILPRVEDDKEEAQRLSEVVPVVLKQTGFEETYSDAGWQKMQEGTGAYGIFWDKDQLGGLGDIAIRKINVLNLFWEPGVTDIQDSRHVFHVALVDNEQLEQTYPELEGKVKSNSVTVSKYLYDDNVDTTDKSLVVDWYYHRHDGGHKTVHYVKFVGKHVLYATENDPELAQRGLYDDGEYPFELDPLYPIEGSPCGYGYVAIGKDTQMDIDTLNQAIVKNATMNATPRYFARKDGGINEAEMMDWSKPLIHYSGTVSGDNLIPVTAPALPGICADIMTQKVEELKFITGNMDVNNGSVPTGVTSGVAIAALKEDAGRSSKDSNRASYRCMVRIYNKVIERIRQFYDLPRQFRILGERGVEKYITYSNAGLKLQPQVGFMGMDMGYRKPVFDIDVRAQRENAYTKMAQNDLALQFYQLGFFNPQLADQTLMALDMMDFKGKDELQQKVSQQAQLLQMAMQMQQIALELARQHDPAIYEQLVAVTQQAEGNPGMALMPAAQPAQQQGGQDDATDKPAAEGNDTPATARMKERVSNATRPQ